jgi:hypothetical protein
MMRPTINEESDCLRKEICSEPKNRERLQLPEKYMQNFDVSSEGPSLGR